MLRETDGVMHGAPPETQLAIKMALRTAATTTAVSTHSSLRHCRLFIATPTRMHHGAKATVPTKSSECPVYWRPCALTLTQHAWEQPRVVYAQRDKHFGMDLCLWPRGEKEGGPDEFL